MDYEQKGLNKVQKSEEPEEVVIAPIELIPMIEHIKDDIDEQGPMVKRLLTSSIGQPRRYLNHTKSHVLMVMSSL